MKAFAIGVGGFVLAAVIAYGGLRAYGQYKKEIIKEQILGDLACQSPSTVQKFGIQCAPATPIVAESTPANVSPPAPTKK